MRAVHVACGVYKTAAACPLRCDLIMSYDTFHAINLFPFTLSALPLIAVNARNNTRSVAR